jgi:hypothetical protein
VVDVPVICIVTIHGIGFQQPPFGGMPGYADDLHSRLSQHLGATLCDDPERPRSRRGENGPIYVQSCWPPATDHIEQGLARLGEWQGDDKRRVDTNSAPLSDGQGDIAHVALVYSRLEGQGPESGFALITGSMVAFSLAHYTHISSLLHMLFYDTRILLERTISGGAAPIPGLHIRSDPGFTPEVHPGGNCGSGAPLSILTELENDVAAYICRDELRERIRSFVLDALLRLACRDDVRGIVINAHSNGTVVAFDVLRRLPPFALAKIQAFVTAGSPLRKYVDLFRWGRHIENTINIKTWLNFWDPVDPVADPLAPPANWRRGDTWQTDNTQPLQTLFQFINSTTGTTTNIAVIDKEVDNVKYSHDGALPAHNYWDNDLQFVRPLSETLRQVAVPVPLSKKVNDQVR